MFRTATGGRNQTQTILHEVTEKTEMMLEGEAALSPLSPFPPVKIPGLEIVANLNDPNRY
jgi:hypothetical protein